MVKLNQSNLLGYKQLLLAIIFSVAISVILFSSSVSAATFTVASGNDENTDNTSCSLTEAIENINNQAQTNTDCPAGDGNADTITLPSGTITLISDLLAITKSINIEGQGMGESIIDGDGQWRPIRTDTFAGEVRISDLTSTRFSDSGLSFFSTENIILERIEVDGSDSLEVGGILSGIGVVSTEDVPMQNINFSAQDIYIHSLNDNAANIMAGILLGTTHDSNLNANINNLTVSNLTNTGGQITGINLITGALDNLDTTGNINAEVTNSTLTNLNSTVASATGIGLLAGVNNGDTTVELNLRNSTISAMNGTTSDSLSAQGIGMSLGDTATSVISTTNSVLASGGCSSSEFTLFGDGAGDYLDDITSNGGNLSDDNTCSDYFTHPTDHNNLTNLSNTLGPLADNDGLIPTMALLEGSPAIDRGVTIAGLTTDARGEARPQGNAYDSGAYESPFSATYDTTDNTDSDQDTLAETGMSLQMFTVVALLSITFALITLIAPKLLKNQ